jgi:predicted Zn-dependent protease
MSDEGKTRLKIAAVIVAVLGAAVAAGFLVRPAYRHWKENRSAAAAQAFFEQGDFRSAWLGAREALLVNSNNLAACRVMAGVADAAHSPATLDWCERVVKLSPAITNQLRLAVAGLRYQSPPYPLTAQILGELSNSASALPDFHVVSAELALSLHRMADAENEFAAACGLEPTNRLFQFNLAVIRLGSTNAAAADAARAQLKSFCTDTNFGPQALRSLAAERLLHDDATGALAYSTQLLAGAQANLSDRLQQLGILKRLQSPDLPAQLAAVQRGAATNAAAAAQTASWMEANGFILETADWLNTLPAGIQTQTPVQLALVDYYLGTTNWQGLCQFAAKADWGEMNFLRLAFLSHAFNQLDQPLVADANWNSAMNLAGNQLGALNALLELAGRWQMKNEQEDLLRRIVRQFPDAGWAQHDLEILYLAAGNTGGLYELYLKQLSRSPQNALLKNNLAATALLLKTNLTQAGEWVAEAYAQSPENPDVVSTYAYALHLQGRDRDGLAALEKLKPAQLEEPSVALYYGVLLSAAGEKDKAARFLAIAEKSGRLLPEEKQLLAEAGRIERP